MKRFPVPAAMRISTTAGNQHRTASGAVHAIVRDSDQIERRARGAKRNSAALATRTPNPPQARVGSIGRMFVSTTHCTKPVAAAAAPSSSPLRAPAAPQSMSAPSARIGASATMGCVP